jgi:membrane-bound serine protease (ClpP class)
MFFRRKNIFVVVLLFIIIILYPSLFFSEEPKRDVMVITLSGVINPVASEYIGKSIKIANEKKVEVLVIELDTPGGLDTSMRNIVKDIIGSAVPVVVYVSPSGSRAASAGVFITLSAHIAAMAPGTNIGAAHPVGIGEKMDKVMAEKATNDAAAYIKSLAERNGRNAKWAEDAVRKSISATEEEALREGVIDLVSKDLNSLLSDIDGKKVRTVMGEKVLNTAKANIIREGMGLRHRILNLISDPNVAYILMLLGFYGLFFELTNPGSIFPGVMGGICLILAFYAFQTLPVNYAGLLLIILAIILFILEVKITALFFSLTLGLAFKAFKRKPVTGSEGLLGGEGVASTDITKDGGMILLHGERWSAYSDELISKGEKVKVEAVSGLKVKVKRQ